jgi:hypothetical protein
MATAAMNGFMAYHRNTARANARKHLSEYLADYESGRDNGLTLDELFNDTRIDSLSKHVVVGEIIKWAIEDRFTESPGKWLLPLVIEARIWEDARNHRLGKRYQHMYDALQSDISKTGFEWS